MFASNIVTCPKRAHAVLAIIGDEREKKENQEDTAGAACRSVDAVASRRGIQVTKSTNGQTDLRVPRRFNDAPA